eukprot:CAMPEP_0118837782 /NCGR_PEP_ID=MMETSP1162-20130426/63843_1 /TAXON_ID=33656 /ORGANISM="Phaeocystis Sp, Strain CCMP2710" /LENGTH=50 /DNA_ID=CAMNT_0006769685 /DNA_START=40 /DNA_END=189 /DNA_ORIENTATION=+
MDPEMGDGRALGTAPAPSLKDCAELNDEKTCTKKDTKWVKRRCTGKKQNK